MAEYYVMRAQMINEASTNKVIAEIFCLQMELGWVKKGIKTQIFYK